MASRLRRQWPAELALDKAAVLLTHEVAVFGNRGIARRNRWDHRHIPTSLRMMLPVLTSATRGMRGGYARPGD